MKRTDIPAYREIDGVSVQFALELSEHIQNNGDLSEPFSKPNWAEHNKRRMTFVDAEIIVHTYHHHSSDIGSRPREHFWFSGRDWECTLYYRHYMMGGEDCFLHYNKFYAIIGYDLTNSEGWLREMTLARMLMHDG